MNKTYKFPALWMMCLMLFSCLTFTACDNGDDEDTNQYKGGISLNVFGPSPVSRGGVLRFLGSGMDKVTAVAISGCDDITDIEVVSDTEIRVTVPQTAQPGLVVLKTPKGDITTKTELTFTEPIALEAFAPAEVKPGSELTITGEYLNLIKILCKKRGKSLRRKIKLLSLHPQSENETYSERQRGSLKSSFEKIFRKIWKGCENELSLHHFPL